MNNIKILKLIREKGPISRRELQEMLDLSFPAVSTAVAKLLEKGLIVPVGNVKKSVGRKPELFELNSKKGHVVGIDVGAKRIRVAVVNLGGNIVHKAEIPTLAYEGGLKVMERLVALIRNVLNSKGISLTNLLAIGVGAPGISEEKSEVNLLSPFIPSWESVPIRSTLEREFGVPVLVENHVDMAVIGERNWGAGRGCDNLVFVNVAIGAAAGIILGGRLYRGTKRAAGEIGFMVVDRSFIREKFSDQGVLESAITGPGIVRRFKDKLTSGGSSSDAISTGGADTEEAVRPIQLEVIDAEAVFALAKSNHRIAREVIDETITYLGMGLSNLSAVLNPEMIVLGGGVGLAIYSCAREKLCRFIENHVPFMPQIVPAELGNDAGVLGAVTVALEKAYERLEKDFLGYNEGGGRDTNELLESHMMVSK